MSKYRIPYGKSQLAFDLPDSFHTELLAPAAIPLAEDPIEAVNAALDQPEGNATLGDLVRTFRGEVAIAINDKTRAVPLAILLPPLLERLSRLGVSSRAITLFVASGTHPPMREDEFPDILPPEILARYRVVCHNIDDPANLVHVGNTSRGTSIWINRAFMEAGLRMVVGNLEPHQFMGFSGGAKTAVIGLAGRETITHNHSMLTDPAANIARYDDNPMRQDVEEMSEIVQVHFALNAVVNENKRIVHAVAGEPRAVMQAGIPYVLELYQVRVPAPFDLMIVSPGGHPKDINLYQSQKALAHATFVTRPGGTVILAAACPEGTGNRHYEEWVIGMPSHAAVLERFAREGFRIGPHKAYQLARDSSRERVLFISEMAPDFVKQLLLEPCPGMDAALNIALPDLAPGARIGIIPWANATIPIYG